MTKKTKEEVIEEFRCSSIQDAALRVIARKGIEGATIQEIAEDAGVAKGTVYVYFRDREELLSRTTDRLFEELLRVVQPAFEMPGTFAAKIRRVVTLQLQFFDEHRSLFRATMALAQREAENGKQRTKSFALYMTRIEKLFAEAGENGELREGLNPDAVAAVHRDLVRGVIQRRLEPRKDKSRSSAEEDADFIVSILLRGVQSGR